MRKTLVASLMVLVVMVGVGFVGCSKGNVVNWDKPSLGQSLKGVTFTYVSSDNINPYTLQPYGVGPIAPHISNLGVQSLKGATFTTISTDINPMTGQPYGAGPVKDFYNSTFKQK